MLARKHRLAVAGLATATAIAIPTAALASGSPSAKPSPPQASAGGPGKPAPHDQLPALAAAAGISVDRLQAGLIAMKRAGGDTPAGIAAFAAAAGVTTATAQRVADAVFGSQADSGPNGAKPAPPGASEAGRGKLALRKQLAALAAAAGISVDRLQAGLMAMKRAGGGTPAGIAAFAAAAGVTSATAQRVADALSGNHLGSPGAKSSRPEASASSPGKPAPHDQLPALAAAAGISVDRLQAGLMAMKRAGGDTPAGIAAFAAAAGVTTATAQRVADA